MREAMQIDVHLPVLKSFVIAHEKESSGIGGCAH